MSSSIDQINLWFDRFDRKFSAFPNIIAETAVEHFQEQFTKESWEGAPWQKRKDKKNHKILYQYGNLFRSIHPAVRTPELVRIRAGDPKVPYAQIHNEGGRVQGKFNVRAHQNSNFMGKGKALGIKAHSRAVNFIMPKRQFMGRSAMLNAKIMTRLAAYYNAAQ